MGAPKDPQKRQLWIERKRIASLGFRHTEKSKEKLRQIALKRYRDGFIPWNKGKKCPQISSALMGYKHTKETKKMMSKNHADVSGDKNPNWKGGKKYYCVDCGKQITNYTYKRCKPCADKEKRNRKPWKGDDVGIPAVHDWVRKHKGKPVICEHCGAKREERMLHWANINHKYKRNLDDYISLCVPCHKKYDRENIQNKQKV